MLYVLLTRWLTSTSQHVRRERVGTVVSDILDTPTIDTHSHPSLSFSSPSRQIFYSALMNPSLAWFLSYLFLYTFLPVLGKKVTGQKQGRKYLFSFSNQLIKRLISSLSWRREGVSECRSCRVWKSVSSGFRKHSYTQTHLNWFVVFFLSSMINLPSKYPPPEQKFIIFLLSLSFPI